MLYKKTMLKNGLRLFIALLLPIFHVAYIIRLDKSHKIMIFMNYLKNHSKIT